jgi:uncharacterized protein (TIGR03066 family)
MRTLFAIPFGVLFLTSVGLTRADDKKEDKKDDTAALIVGLWEITKAGGDVGPGSTLDLLKGGKVVLTVKGGDADQKLEGTYKLAKDKLTITLNVGGNEVQQEVTVKKLKGDDMELEDAAGGIDVLKRKKKKD